MNEYSVWFNPFIQDVFDMLRGDCLDLITPNIRCSIECAVICKSWRNARQCVITTCLVNAHDYRIDHWLSHRFLNQTLRSVQTDCLLDVMHVCSCGNGGRRRSPHTRKTTKWPLKICRNLLKIATERKIAAYHSAEWVHACICICACRQI